MESVNVLVGVDGVDHRGLVDVLGERELDQDAVDLGIAIQLANQGQQFGLAGLGGERVLNDFMPSSWQARPLPVT